MRAMEGAKILKNIHNVNYFMSLRKRPNNNKAATYGPELEVSS